MTALAMAGATPVASAALFVVVEAGLLELIILNKVALTIGALFTISAAVSALRDPPDGWYKWFYRFANMMTANTAFKEASMMASREISSTIHTEEVISK